MRIAAMAAGAVGAYFGARLQAAGHDVFYIARGAHREAIEKDGLRIESVHGDLHLTGVNVTDDPAKVGPVDVVLFAVKLWDTEQAAEQMKPLLGPDTRGVTLQNGVDSYERIAPIVGAELSLTAEARVLGREVPLAEAPRVVFETDEVGRVRVRWTSDGGDGETLVEASAPG
ncbi:MAG: 2-dehydropantoate 2-reductase, partial [Pseudolabrys sp.]